jgi:hypothetical protein
LFDHLDRLPPTLAHRGWAGYGGTSRVFNRLTTLFKFEIRIWKSEIHLPEAGKNSKL